ncbi:MAG: permease-like cell division protein FtsX [Gammaproteobacteria bacterium]|nr:permease-like cell division protein FtsX [Gammaproteobacteria bacterium]
MKRPRRNQRHSQYHWRNRLRRLLSPGIWLHRHASVARDSLERMGHNRLSSIMTAAVIGIALAMPSTLYLLLDNLDRLSGSWDSQASLSIFLKDTVTPETATRLLKTVQGWPEIGSAELITPAQALDEFSQHSGFADVLETLERNPLPTVLVIQPVAAHALPETAGALRDKFSKLPETEFAQLDLQWVQRLTAMLDIARRGVLVISSLLALAVLLVIGNTIRLEIQNRHDEIVVTKLIGATNAFVRRPFLYSGIWYGALGAVFAWLLVEGGFLFLSAPVAKLAGLYQSGFSLQTLPFQLLYLLLSAGILLGLLGSWLAVGRHLNDIQPR